jgi:hypothetical protein
MKKTILIIILTLSIFVCKAQSEDPICRQAFENAKKVYLEKGRDEGKKSFDLVFACEDSKISVEAKDWIEKQEKAFIEDSIRQEEARQRAIQDSIDRENKRKIYGANTPIETDTNEKTFWEDVTDYFEDSFDNLEFGHQLYYSYSDIYPIIFSYNRAYSPYISFGVELGFDTKRENVKGIDYDPSIYFMRNIGFNTNLLSLYLGVGPAYFWGKGSFGLNITQSTTITQGGEVISSQSVNDSQYQLGHSVFVLKPSISLNLPLGVYINCGYFIFPSKVQLNCLSLGLGFSF